ALFVGVGEIAREAAADIKRGSGEEGVALEDFHLAGLLEDEHSVGFAGGADAVERGAHAGGKGVKGDGDIAFLNRGEKRAGLQRTAKTENDKTSRQCEPT